MPREGDNSLSQRESRVVKTSIELPVVTTRVGPSIHLIIISPPRGICRPCLRYTVMNYIRVVSVDL